MRALGNYVDGQFVPPAGAALISRNPAADGAVVLETGASADAIGPAFAAAAAAQPAWAARSRADRVAQLGRFKDAIAARAGELADAIVLETGKIRSEAKAEIQTLLARFDLSRAAIEADLKDGPVAGAPGESLRYAPLGVVGVIGPFNFPLHLCHAHVIPALLAGNTVVIKPSEVSPLCGQRYAEAADAAGLPPGVFNLIQGTGAVGAAMLADPHLRGLCFTGSWPVGRRILEATLDRPEVLVALEMGGKNACVVLDDAALRQAVHEVLVGGYLSAGQRCTGTDRVLVHRAIAPQFLAALTHAARELRFGPPEDPSVFAGPVATEAALHKLEVALAAARAAGAEPLVAGQRLPGGWYRTASLHRLPDGVHHVPGYTDVEVFGPDLCVEVVESDDEAIAVLAASPYGFANAVFTGSRARFETFAAQTRSGILNRNRSTNLASPRMPFGGVGKSGNYRPAGAWAHRNVVSPVATLENVIGAVTPHAQLADLLPPPDLDRLERQHTGEEACEAARNLVDSPRPMAVARPPGGRLPTSAEWLARLYAGDRVPREKKPLVFDHLRSAGPWMVSVDAEPQSVLDGMSQTATVCGGFAEDPVVAALVEGRFADTLVADADTAVAETPAWAEFASTLRQLVPGLPHVTFVASGAEANEKALALCHLHCARPGARKVLAFDGSFHGRTLLAIHATHSPSKRAPFELAGYEATFAPFPVWDTPGDEPDAPSGYYAAAASGDLAELLERFGDGKEDPLLASELRALAAVDGALATGEYFVCTVEPMQSEGGDRYATERFFRALRLLTRRHATFLCFDEVQVGFGLGGAFAWHSKFRLLNSRGQPDYPDAVVFAKRAQVGVVMSRFDDPEPGSAHNASLVRGRLHADMMSTSHAASRIDKLVRPRLDAVARAYPHLVGHPRGCGYAFAFDLPTPALLDAFIGQRFWRGAVVFAAGTRTARYRLSESFGVREIDFLFETIRRSLSWLDAHPGKKPPEWEDLGGPAAVPDPDKAGIRFRSVPHTEAMDLLPAILDIEYQVYEPARRTPPAEIRAALAHPEGSVVVAETGAADKPQLVGFAIGAPLEESADVEGPDDDPMLGTHNTMYSVSITVAPGFQNSGVGRRLKELQLQGAMAQQRPGGGARYRYVTGRNRVGRTAQMTHLNRVFGAHVVQVLTGQYEDPEGQAIYYRIPLGPITPEPSLRAHHAARHAGHGDHVDERPPLVHDLASGLTRPLAQPPASLQAAESGGLLYGPGVNKITLMNYVTPATVRGMEWISALAPDLPHMYLTSSRDETVDKALRLIKCSRKEAHLAIGLGGGYLGHTVASTRSLSDPEVHRGGKPYFAWPRVPHPAVAGAAASIAAIRAAVADAGGPSKVLGLVYELVGERTGYVLPEDFLTQLAAVRVELDLPLICVEHTTAGYRGAGERPRAPFAYPSTGLRPDVLAWWGGGQTGYLHTTARWFIGSPLTLVSTWDGDELTLVRHHHHLRALRRLDHGAVSRALDEALAEATRAGLAWHGQGGYRVLHAGARAVEIEGGLAARGVRVRRYPNGGLGLAPALDEAVAASRVLGDALREVLA
ncbi:MAG: aldehyde dehydrogenase family protein [Kofleriaceae bacterium]|nr:aldehyde dehydrogenase family protein [Kofleriaceae bacterium]MBP6837896.1 aldehyde dehydrogenase family protein [Kofleriaceae bacterium]MBP9205475.1 aldehyde dehydrogenase family protein [Kofleriaceae bacterium]